jgi:hypothetical protein
MTSGRRIDPLINILTMLITILLLFGLLGEPVPAQAKLVTVTDIPNAIPEDLLWGQILREVRIEGNKYTREWVIRKALKSQIGHPYTQENARLSL